MRNVLQRLKGLGSGFTADRAYASSYPKVEQAARDVDRALGKYKDALQAVERAV